MIDRKGWKSNVHIYSALIPTDLPSSDVHVGHGSDMHVFRYPVRMYQYYTVYTVYWQTGRLATARTHCTYVYDIVICYHYARVVWCGSVV